MSTKPFKITVNDTQVFDVKKIDADLLDSVANNAEGTAFHVLSAEKAYQIEVIEQDLKNRTITLKVNGEEQKVYISDKYDQLINQLGLKKAGSQKVNEIKAPMPGLVLEISVTVGQTLAKGDKVAILEAMKMENVLKAAGDGIVKSIEVQKGTAVEKGQILIILE